MDSKIKLIEESTKKIDTMDTKISQVDEAIKQSDSMQTNQANQDLKQEMDKMKTYINNEVDDVFEEMQKMETSIRETIPYMLCHEISKEDGSFSKALQTQIHKIVKEYQQLHRT